MSWGVRCLLHASRPGLRASPGALPPRACARTAAGLSFREEQWLNTRPLSVGTVMDYFRLSPWYDPGSINARAIEQGLAPEAARCARMRGLRVGRRDGRA